MIINPGSENKGGTLKQAKLNANNIAMIKDQLAEIIVELKNKRIDRNLIFDYAKQCQHEIKEIEKNL